MPGRSLDAVRIGDASGRASGSRRRGRARVRRAGDARRCRCPSPARAGRRDRRSSPSSRAGGRGRRRRDRLARLDDHDRDARLERAADRDRRNWRSAAGRGTAIDERRPRAAPIARRGRATSSAGRRARRRTTGRRRGTASRSAPRSTRSAVGEEAGVAAELVDDEALMRAAVAPAQHRMGADEAGDDAAAVDVADEDDRNIGRLGKPHVGDVAGAQVDLGRAARALDEDDVGAVADDSRSSPAPAAAARPCAAPYSAARIVPSALPLHDDLRAGLALRLEQHRVHVDRRRAAARPAPAAPAPGRSRRRRRRRRRCSTCSAA